MKWMWNYFRIYELFIYLNFMWVIVAFSWTSHWLAYGRCDKAVCSTVYNSVQIARADILRIPWFFYIIECQKVIVLTVTKVPADNVDSGSKLLDFILLHLPLLDLCIDMPEDGLRKVRNMSHKCKDNSILNKLVLCSTQ